MNHDIDNPQDRDERLRGLINKGAELAGGAAGAAVGMVIGSFLAGPAGAAVGGTVGTAATMAVTTIGHDLSSRLLSPKEQLRVGGVYTLAAGEIVERCESMTYRQLCILQLSATKERSIYASEATKEKRASPRICTRSFTNTATSTTEV